MAELKHGAAVLGWGRENLNVADFLFDLLVADCEKFGDLEIGDRLAGLLYGLGGGPLAEMCDIRLSSSMAFTHFYC